MSSRSYKYQKRKPRNLARIATDQNCDISKDPGCYYPQKGAKCPPGTEGTAKCDARLRTKATASQLKVMDRIRYFLDRGRIQYASGIAFRRKYGAYEMDDDNNIVIKNYRNHGNYGKLKPGFDWYYKGPKALQDGFSPPEYEPAVINQAASESAFLWKTKNGKRYHYQGEALIRDGASYLWDAWVDFHDDIYNSISSDKSYNDVMKAIASTLSKRELEVLIFMPTLKPVRDKYNISDLYPNLEPPAYFHREYEYLLDSLPVGKEREPPSGNLEFAEKIMITLFERMGYIPPQPTGEELESPLLTGEEDIPAELLEELYIHPDWL